MTISFDETIGIKEVCLPYSSLEQAAKNITILRCSTNDMEVHCGEQEDISKKFFLFIVTEKQAHLGIFRDEEFVGDYEQGGKRKLFYLKEAEDEQDREDLSRSPQNQRSLRRK